MSRCAVNFWKWHQQWTIATTTARCACDLFRRNIFYSGASFVTDIALCVVYPRYLIFVVVCSGDAFDDFGELQVKLIGVEDFHKVNYGELLPSTMPRTRCLNSICLPPEEKGSDMFDPYAADMWMLGA